MKALYATILYAGIFLAILFPFDFAGAYSVGTHALLTKESVEFYNKNFPNYRISSDLKDYIIDGARLEDNTPRYLNHFYDPINDRGLADGGFRGEKSKDWANDASAQTAFLYRSLSPSEASILSLAQVEKIKSSFDQSDFTWNKAIDLYLDGKKEEALFTLGHIIHLIEDMSVPDHVRNDAHPPYDNGGSPYENWTARFNLDNSDASLKSRLNGKALISLGDLNSYFTDLAKYTNANFYSADSIKNFAYPVSDNFIINGNYEYGIKKDEVGEYKLIRKESGSIFLTNSGDLEKNNSLTIEKWSIDAPIIMSDYWSRLSVKSVQYGAGVIDLFFKDAEKEKQKRAAGANASSKYLGQVLDLLKGFIPDFSGNKNLNLASTIDLMGADSKNTTSAKDAVGANNPDIPADNPELINIQDFNSDTQNEDASLVAVEKPEVIEPMAAAVPVVEKKAVQVCTFATDKSASRQKLLINEVAWMGGINSANDEWIELRNISGGVLDISGWQLLDKGEQIKVTFGNLKLASGAYVLLERTDDNSVPEIKADAVYAGALSNADEGLRLFDSGCDLMDEVLAGGDWPAGDSAARRTMERASDLSWHTYAGSGSVKGGISIFGTPRQDNSQPGVANSGSSAAVSLNSDNAAPLATSTVSGPARILISEIQITGGTGKANNDFIELYNPNSGRVNLNGYRLVKRTKTGTSDSSIKSWTADEYIPAGGYYLWANSDYADISAVPDIKTSATLSNDNGVAIRFGSADTGDIIDSVAWGAASNAFVENLAFSENPIANQSISRQSETDTNNNSVDYIKTLLSPKNSSNSGGFILPTAWSGQSASAVSYFLISEVYPDRTGENKDFVEIYNPNASGTQALSLSGWSLQILSANATTTGKIIKKNFENGNAVPASGFFLVGIDSFVGGDISWSGGSLNSTEGATIFLVDGTTAISDFDDPKIIDKIAYGSGPGLMSSENSAAPLPSSGKSLERKALHSGACISAAGAGEYLGNGCDTDDNSSDFEERAISKPQKLSNLPEPRNAPSAPANLSGSYASTTLKVSFNWDLSSDASGSTSTLSYSLQYATSTNPLQDHETISATSTYSYKISEVGIDYVFSLKAKDAEGLESSASSISMQIPSILSGAYFYPDPRTSGNNVIELRYDSYPFIYPIQVMGGFRTAVLYKNQEAPAIPYFYSDTQYATTQDGVEPKIYGEWGSNMSGAWKLRYPSCSGSFSEYTSLILPDSTGYCSNAFGGIRNGAVDLSKKLEDLNINVDLSQSQTAPVAGDYFTVGFYTHTGDNIQTLAAVDRKKYYFLDEVPAHQPPELGGPMTVNFNKQTSKLEIGWQKAADSDTWDNLITYEISYNGGADWQSAGSQNNTQKTVAPGQDLSILVRAKDDFGNYSDPPIRSYWSYPATVFYVAQAHADDWSAGFGTKNENCPSCAGKAGIQSIQPQENFEFNVVTLKLKQELAADSAILKLAVYPDLNGLPDFGALIGEAQLTDMFGPDSDSDIAFTFDDHISVAAQVKYWLVLSVKEYSDSRGYYRNQWQNAISVGGDFYGSGQAGRGNSGTCDGYCSFTVPYPDASADWYMKIGLSE